MFSTSAVFTFVQFSLLSTYNNKKWYASSIICVAIITSVLLLIFIRQYIAHLMLFIKVVFIILRGASLFWCELKQKFRFFWINVLPSAYCDSNKQYFILPRTLVYFHRQFYACMVLLVCKELFNYTMMATTMCVIDLTFFFLY